MKQKLFLVVLFSLIFSSLVSAEFILDFTEPEGKAQQSSYSLTLLNFNPDTYKYGDVVKVLATSIPGPTTYHWGVSNGSFTKYPSIYDRAVSVSGGKGLTVYCTITEYGKRGVTVYKRIEMKNPPCPKLYKPSIYNFPTWPQSGRIYSIGASCRTPNVSYKWTVSSGRIISGANSRWVTVEVYSPVLFSMKCTVTDRCGNKQSTVATTKYPGYPIEPGPGPIVPYE